MRRVKNSMKYGITKDGRVWSFHNNKWLKPVILKIGYPTVIFGHKDRKYIHRLVAETYIPNPKNYKEVNHKNGIKTDNRIENLEWCSSSQNKKHAYDFGLKPSKIDKDGQDFIIKNKNRLSGAELARILGVSRVAIYYRLKTL